MPLLAITTAWAIGNRYVETQPTAKQLQESGYLAFRVGRAEPTARIIWDRQASLWSVERHIWDGALGATWEQMASDTSLNTAKVMARRVARRRPPRRVDRNRK